MTLPEYIKNPMGKENAVFSQRNMYKDLYESKFSKIMLREGGLLKYYLYQSGKNKYLIHLRIPSEVIEKFYYDTVIEFYSNDPAELLSQSLNGYSVKFYSNDPAFVYTYAYSFKKNKLFIDDLAPKMSKIALTEKADIKNPKNLVGYVKSIFFAYIYMHAHGLDKKSTWVNVRNYDKNELLATIMDADTKVALRQKAGAALPKIEKPSAKRTPGGKFTPIKHISGNGNSETRIRNTRKVKMAGSTVHNVRTVKRK